MEPIYDYSKPSVRPEIKGKGAVYWTVEYDEDIAAYVAKNEVAHSVYSLSSKCPNCKVAGNVYENPELLEEI